MIEHQNHKFLKAWPFQEAIKIVKSLGNFSDFKHPKKDYVLFETGYGPSGLPHIGNFGEFVRTTMVRNALESLVNCKTKLITFSDDMDGLRKVPENVPNKDMLKNFIGIPLTSIPDPFEKYESFGHHNNAKLRSFLDKFNFQYDFVSSSDKYKSGDFDKTLINILNNYQSILSIILPSLRSERQGTYSPFLPISPSTGQVLQVKIEEYNLKQNSIVFIDPYDDKKTEVPVTGGNCKLQWKVDWAMRWMALNVDYEMCGKDLTESVDLASKICNVLGKKAPQNLIYEMFLDEKGEKISKSVGNGISVDEWLRYASPESLSLYMFQKPRSAKKLFFDIIPKSIDEYYSHLDKFENLELKDRYNSPIWHIHNGNCPQYKNEITFISLLNLVSICNSSEKDVIWGFVNEYDPNLNKEDNMDFDLLIEYAINYYNDFVLPNKKYLKVSDENKSIFIELRNFLKSSSVNSTAEDIQTEIYEIGKKNNFENLRDFFKLIYQVLLGQEQGPRLGSFIKLYGIKKTIKLIDDVIDSI
jgi:lysyl-tRNA synthetase class 1